MDRIPVSGPWITPKEIAYVTEAVTNAWYGNANVYHERFEKAFAEYVGRRYAVALPSCTAAIHLALLALGIGPGDEVIVPETTWIATAAPITYVGATPVFADIDAQTWCLSVDAFEKCLSPRTKAVIPVDLYGNMPDMAGLQALAQRQGVALIEDAAEAIGSEFEGGKAGSFGAISVFSFHGSKTLTTGEGGMLVTDRDEVYQRVRFLRDHGRQAGDRLFWNSEVAYKYKMSSMQAALGLAQLERIDELVDRKRTIFNWYQAELAGNPAIRLNCEPAGTHNSYWMVTALLDAQLGIKKEWLTEALAAKGIDSRPFFYPLSSLPAYANHPAAQAAQSRNCTSYALSPYGINLPSALSLSHSQVQFVCQILQEIVRDHAG